MLSVLLLSVGDTKGYKILFLTPFPGASHWPFMQHIVKALLDRNHEMTVITSKTWNGPKPPNYTEILVDPPFDLDKYHSQSQIYKSESRPTDVLTFLQFNLLFKAVADHSLNDSNVQQFLHEDNLSFDVVINEEVCMESFLMFAHKFKAPLMIICKPNFPISEKNFFMLTQIVLSLATSFYQDFFDKNLGLLTPISHVPNTVINSECYLPPRRIKYQYYHPNICFVFAVPSLFR